ncbi:MAG: phosphatidylglycerophosphatase A [Gammaproteobacteria bacterium]|nr:MAG: phosphatidylglycerophosphatase A [Gammaproteobacteria bacterium]
MKRNIAPASVWRNPIHLLAFGLGAGASPYAPGTVGTLLGVPIVWLLADWPLWVYLLVTAVLVLVGIWVCEKTSRDIGVHDHSGIVIDEIAGYLITMIAVPVNIWTLLAGFILFRIFDVAKPWPIHWLDKRVKGGFGIMIDDVIAGVFALTVMWLGLVFLDL